MHRILIEASPFLQVSEPTEMVKKNLYNLPFSYNKIANKIGNRPEKLYGFWESDNRYAERLENWEKTEEEVLFEGWECKDMYQYQELIHRKGNVIITLEMQGYEVNTNGRKFFFPTHPETIDEFITDLKRIGITLFWKQRIADIYGIKSITANQKIIDYYGYIKEQEGS